MRPAKAGQISLNEHQLHNVPGRVGKFRVARARSIAFHSARSWRVHRVELAVVDVEPVQRRPAQIEEAKLLRSLPGAASDEKGVDLQGEEGGEGVPLRWGLARLVVGDDETTVVVPVDPVEDPPDRDPVEVFEHVQLAVHRVEPGRVFDAEVVGEKGEGLHAPSALRRSRRTGLRTPRSDGDLGPSFPEQAETGTRVERSTGRMGSESRCNAEMGRGASSL